MGKKQQSYLFFGSSLQTKQGTCRGRRGNSFGTRGLHFRLEPATCGAGGGHGNAWPPLAAPAPYSRRGRAVLLGLTQCESTPKWSTCGVNPPLDSITSSYWSPSCRLGPYQFPKFNILPYLLKFFPVAFLLR